MSRINPDLLQRLQQKLGRKRSRVYALIDQKVRDTQFPRHLAAVVVASENGVNVSRYGSLLTEFNASGVEAFENKLAEESLFLGGLC